MKFITLLSFVATLALTSFCARAEDNPPPGGTGVSSGPSVPSVPSVPSSEAGTKTAARKEDEDETPKSKGFNLASLKQYLPTTRKGAGNAHARVSELEAENKTLSDRIKALEDGSAVKALTEANTKLRGDLESFALAAQERGLFEESPEPGTPAAQSKEGKAVNAIIAGAVAREIRSIGHDPSKTAPEGAAKTAADTTKLSPLQLISIGRAKQKAALN